VYVCVNAYTHMHTVHTFKNGEDLEVVVIEVCMCVCVCCVLCGVLCVVCVNAYMHIH